MQSSLSPDQSPTPSRTANASGLPSVQSLHSARMFNSSVGSKVLMIGLIFLPLMPPLSFICPTKSLMAFDCSVYSTSPAKPISLESACRFTTGKTTLISVLVTPLALVLASVTGVGALAAPEAAGGASPAAPAMTVMAPSTPSSLRPTAVPPSLATVGRSPMYHDRRSFAQSAAGKMTPASAMRHAPVTSPDAALSGPNSTAMVNTVGPDDTSVLPKLM